MYFVFFFNFYFTFLTKEFFFLRPIMEYTFLESKQNVGVGINVLMSVSGGFRSSISCRKMEKAYRTREEMDGKVIYFPPESAFLTLML